jgi:hypothetical protein
VTDGRAALAHDDDMNKIRNWTTTAAVLAAVAGMPASAPAQQTGANQPAASGATASAGASGDMSTDYAGRRCWWRNGRRYCRWY